MVSLEAGVNAAMLSWLAPITIGHTSVAALTEVALDEIALAGEPAAAGTA